ncbi:MAG: prolyl oligopeptidase family serine peptidase [Oscillospiraceae bacterium]|nr:prolyl oligopeptidase family serine peptidase [Oscillospiraceae bacterium]
MSNISFSHVPYAGWTGLGFSIDHAPAELSDVTLTLSPRGAAAPIPVAVRSVTAEGETLKIETDEFDYRGNWVLCVGDDKYTRAEMDEERVEGLEVYESKQEDGVLYRLYTPEARGPRPLLLFLHGGGNGGDDNITHIAADYGVIQFAQRYPDFYVMAPQAMERKGVLPKMNAPFAETDQTGPYGWSRAYLGAVCDLIRKMIAEGKVDARRVYVTGMSMGGAGTLRAMSVGAGLFAAAVPVCPSMTPETFRILCGLKHSKLWIATAYVDHTIYRHKYIVDGIMALRDAGNQNAHLTLYSPEELAAFGIATDPDLTLKERFSANHASWVPTYHNEHGIMSWLTEQVLEV